MPLRLTFGQKILLATSLIIVSAFSLFTLYNDSLQRRAIRSALEGQLDDLGQVTANNVENWLGGRILLVDGVAQAISRNGINEDATALLSLDAVRNSFFYSYLGRADGSFQISPDEAAPEGYDPRTRPWYKAGAAARSTTLTEPYRDATEREVMLTVAAPIREGERLLGVVGGDLSLKTLVKIINGLDLDGMGYAFLVSADGKVLVHQDEAMVMKNLRELFPQGAPTIGPGFSEVQVEGATRILSFTPIKGLPSLDWYVGLSVDKAKAFELLSEFRASAIVVTLIAVVSSIALLGMLIRVLMQPLLAMSKAMQDIAEGEGDLTRRLSVHSNDEFGKLASAFNRFVERIHGTISAVSTATREVNQAAQLVLDASNSSMGSSDQQAQRTHSVAAAINQLGAAAQEIALNAAQASHRASDARHQSEAGRRVVEQTIQAMSELSGKISASCLNIEGLNSKTVNIGQILEVIKSISQQTNLLALNAAIEAARAGEAGRGFAVVADEVRSLAHRTQESAQEIHRMIEELQVGAREAVATMAESQRYSEQSVEIANQAGERLGGVTQRIGEIDGMNQSVASATEEQTSVVEALNMDINEINTLNQAGVENLQASLRACDDLGHQVARLKQLVDSFRI